MQGAISYVPCRCHRKYLLEAAEERCTVVTAESRPGHIEPGDWVPKMLKKELSDLKSYFQELGFSYDPVKENGQEDLIVRRPHGADSLLFLTAKEQK